MLTFNYFSSQVQSFLQIFISNLPNSVTISFTSSFFRELSSPSGFHNSSKLSYNYCWKFPENFGKAKYTVVGAIDAGSKLSTGVIDTG
jgi:hypothetical protein